jgi:hypothetical protein
MICLIWDVGVAGFLIGGDLPGAFWNLCLSLFLIAGIVFMGRVLLLDGSPVFGEGERS